MSEELDSLQEESKNGPRAAKVSRRAESMISFVKNLALKPSLTRSKLPPPRTLVSFRTPHLKIPTPKPRALTTTSLTRYAFGREIGKGAYATTKIAVLRQTQERVAAKIYKKSSLLDPQRMKSVNLETQVMRTVNHPNIVKFIERIDSPNEICLMMELVEGQSLQIHVHRNLHLPESEAQPIFHGIVQAVAYCHGKKIVHRDIKLENILLDHARTPKLIDFGFSAKFSDTRRFAGVCGTPSYMAPEILQRKEYEGHPTDIWALGIVLFVMLCGTFPFKGHSDQELHRKIQRGVVRFPEFLSESAKEVIDLMLRVDPKTRATATELLDHPWVKNRSNI